MPDFETPITGDPVNTAVVLAEMRVHIQTMQSQINDIQASLEKFKAQEFELISQLAAVQKKNTEWITAVNARTATVAGMVMFIVTVLGSFGVSWVTSLLGGDTVIGR